MPNSQRQCEQGSVCLSIHCKDFSALGKSDVGLIFDDPWELLLDVLESWLCGCSRKCLFFKDAVENIWNVKMSEIGFYKKKRKQKMIKILMMGI